ncbi:putative bifunctional diguanylate cyclase/phosphodiesterase [Rhizorhapis sp. SPR117]|uniref:putative bifunctional diguanylate cyclase/phosphodiesterase n=1 Tax=Rhizorhapis sp. SPR117 TaxID=2912611 RepID=UPI00403EEBC0
MGAIPSDFLTDSSGPDLPFPALTPVANGGAVETPDWLTAIPLPAAILSISGDAIQIEAYNASYSIRFLEQARAWVAGKGAEYPLSYARVVRAANSGQPSSSFDVVKDGALGTEYWTCALGRLADGTDGARRLLMTVVDRTNERQTEKNLRRELVLDSLTGLPNRTGFGEEIDARLTDGELEPITQYAILTIDLVRFSRINESLGSLADDELIITVARRLKSSLRQGDILGRLGGNEFGIFARLNNGLSDALQIVQRVNSALGPPCRLSNLQLSIEIAVGCALSEDEAETPEDILRQSQVAVKLAKKSGKMEIYRPGVLRQAWRRFNMESNLREALANGQLDLAFHPLINLKSGAIAGFEALARWNDAELGCISPVEFIPVAEESGLINPLGRWAMYEAAQTLAKWDRQFGKPLPIGINVNLSPIQMARDDVPNVVEEALRYSGISGKRLTVELTESAIIADPEKARKVLSVLKALDVSVAMDDFGTGFSNLASLQRLPIDILKIDRSFITEMLMDKDKKAIVRAILSLAKSLKLATTAEGVESAELSHALASYGCEHGQGFHFAEPMPAEQAYEFWLARNS